MTDKTIVALFDEFDDAQAAVRDLEAEGIAQSRISMVAHDADRRTAGPGTATSERARDRRDSDDTKAGEGAGTGATIGAVIGGGGGLLAGLGMLAIPGIGPVVAAGPLVAALTGAGAGAAAGGILGGLVGLGIPEHEAHAYAEGVRRGGTLVTVRADDTEADRVTDILERHDPVDVDERGQHWKESGWNRFDTAAEPYPAHDIARDRERYRTMFGAASASPTGTTTGTTAGTTTGTTAGTTTGTTTGTTAGTTGATGTSTGTPRGAGMAGTSSTAGGGMASGTDRASGGRLTENEMTGRMTGRDPAGRNRTRIYPLTGSTTDRSTS